MKQQQKKETKEKNLWKCKGGWGGDNAKQKLLQTIVAMKDAGTTL
jgi:hypothetical protein